MGTVGGMVGDEDRSAPRVDACATTRCGLSATTDGAASIIEYRRSREGG
jgi:hypothetical protein